VQQHNGARNPDHTESYRPRQQPTALKVMQGNLESKQDDEAMASVPHPIANKVNSVILHVTDLRRSAAWYSMVMGIPLLEERLNGGPVYWLQLACGTGMLLDDHSNEPDEPRAQFSYSTHDAEAAYRMLGGQGVVLLNPIQRPHDGLAHFSFADPDGNIIMVVQSDYEDQPIERLAHAESPILNRIGGIFVHVSDMNRAIEFHSEVLGVPRLEVDSESSGGIYNMPTNGRVDLLLDINHLVNRNPDRAQFMLVTHDVEASRSYLAGHGIEAFTDIQRFGPIAFFTVKDPDGNEIMICANDEDSA